MVIDTVSANTIIKSDLQQLRSKTEVALTSREEFDKVLSDTLNSVKNEKLQAEPVKTADVAEIIKLEMLRSSLSIGQVNAEPVQGSVGRKISLLLDKIGGYDKNQTGLENVQDNPVCVDSDCKGQGLTGLDGIINKASERYGVDAGLIKAVIKAESNFNPRAVSRAGAEGLMQLMPSTAQGLGVTNSFDPEQNVMAGTRFLKQMLDRYDGNINSALAAYNWGPGNVEKKGSALPRETREYLMRVKGYYAEYSA